MTRQQNCGVHFPKDIPSFVEVFPGGIFLDDSDKRIARFGVKNGSGQVTSGAVLTGASAVASASAALCGVR